MHENYMVRLALDRNSIFAPSQCHFGRKVSEMKAEDEMRWQWPKPLSDFTWPLNICAPLFANPLCIATLSHSCKAETSIKAHISTEHNRYTTLSSAPIADYAGMLSCIWQAFDEWKSPDCHGFSCQISQGRKLRRKFERKFESARNVFDPNGNTYNYFN